MIIAGIDPGMTGAVVVANWKTRAAPRILDVLDMPVTEAAGVTVIDTDGISKLMYRWTPDLIVVEGVSPSPKQGVGNAFKFGGAYLSVISALAAGPRPAKGILTPAPRAWKRKLGVPAKDNQAEATRIVRHMATKVFGAAAGDTHWPFQKDHDRAEAALLTKYGSLSK